MNRSTAKASSAVRDRTAPAEPAGPMLAWREVPAILFRRWTWIVAGVLEGFVGALLALLLLPATYTASTEILVQPTDLKAVEASVSQAATQPDTAVALLETAARVLASRKVLDPVVTKLGLADDPEFQRDASGLREIVADARYLLQTDSKAAKPEPSQIALEQLSRNILVRRSERTFVITLSVKSNDPVKAARIASAIVASFFEVQAGARADAARQVSESLASRLAGLRAGVRRSEDAVQAFEVANNLTVANGQIVNEQQLSEASAQLLAAERRLPAGQTEACVSLGMSKLSRLQHILLPQVYRAIMPSIGNELILVLKASSLASAVTVMEMTGAARSFVSRTYAPFEVFTVAGVLYLAVGFTLALAFGSLERRIPGSTAVKRGARPAKPRQQPIQAMADQPSKPS